MPASRQIEITPGDQELTVRVAEPWGGDGGGAFTFHNDPDASSVVLTDRDTGEILAPVVFPRREVTLTGPGQLIVPFSVPAFTN